ncbi:MAG: glycosyltransferase family 4 protein [Rhodospirillales bacterium]
MKTQRIGITWQITDIHGWGVFGLNVALELARHGPVPPLIISDYFIAAPTPRINRLLGPYLKAQPEVLRQINDASGQTLLSDTLLLHSLGNGFMHSPITERVSGHANIGFIFFENGALNEAALTRARYFDSIIAGSSWNRDTIKAHGFESTAFVSQGVDLERFRPRAKSGAFGDRFVVFSGGKLELRKAQDTVLAAFKIFHTRHPDALLLSNWHNSWPVTARDIARSPHVDGSPDIDEMGVIDFNGWVIKAGLPDEAYRDVGPVPNAHLPPILSEVDVALFPNRCEGGTNLVAMEAMASGVPCILSANTGHLDIITGDNCYALQQQTVSPPDIDPSGVWRESDIDEILDVLESAYTDREEAQRRARAGVQFMQGLSWENQTRALIGELSAYM